MNHRILTALVPTGALLLACIATAEPARPEPKAPAAADAQEFVFLGESRPVLVRLQVQRDGKPLSAAWDDCMKYLFNYLDVNGDGVLSKDEAERAPSMELLQGGIAVGLGGGGGPRGGGGAMAGPKMEDLDTNGDGKVTLEELSAYYRKKGFLPFQFQLEAAQYNQFLGAAAFFGGPPPEPSVDAVSKAIFNLLDTGSDGKLTKEKLAAAEKILLQRDEDQDEIVTTQELVPGTGNDFANLTAMFAMRGPGKPSTATSSLTLVPVQTPGEVPTDLVKRLQERYSKGTLLEGKKITRESIGLDEELFKKLDKNGDGKLDAEELPAFVKRAPDLEVVLRLGKKADGATRFDVVKGDGRSPLSSKVQVQESTALLDLGLTRAELRTSSDEAEADTFGYIIRQQLAIQFKQADTNADGFIDENEAKNSRLFKNLFKTLDRNGNGKVSEKDLDAFIDHIDELQKRVTAACVTLELTDQSRGLFDLLDTNRDGRLSVRELRQAPKLLEQFDRGKKGYLTKDDLPHTYRLEVRRGPLAAGALNGAAAFFKGLYTPAKAEPETSTRGPLWFRKMDRNRDGDISRKEWLFDEELFKKIDTDGDGLISVEEAEAYDAQRRKEEKP
jgi:Ca2+-binding EF-hand superfamily protein